VTIAQKLKASLARYYFKPVSKRPNADEDTVAEARVARKGIFWRV
jgi:hypothetical protein